jgi:hypothetical protein
MNFHVSVGNGLFRAAFRPGFLLEKGAPWGRLVGLRIRNNFLRTRDSLWESSIRQRGSPAMLLMTRPQLLTTAPGMIGKKTFPTACPERRKRRAVLRIHCKELQ